MAEARGPKVFTIPLHRGFADALVTGILKTHGKDRLTLARGTILLPNNRAVEAVRDAFVRQAEGGLLLPRLVPIGDPELDDRTGAALDAIDDDPIPPAVEPLRRQMILARLIQQERSFTVPVDAAEAMRLAADLGRVLDQMHIEEVAPAKLKSVDLGTLSTHWQQSLELLAPILDRWPEELARLGAIDLADRRNRLLHRVEARWRATPPTGFVIAAGISTGAKAVGALLRTVARLDAGMVVFAGLDMAMPDAEWDAVIGSDEALPIETHPQFHLAQLLGLIGVARGEVAIWRWGGEADARAERSRAVSNALAPARFTDKWAGLAPPDKRLSGVTAIELATPADEAQAIALAMREAIERPGTVALVTPDRALARRVSAHLRRWGITADDSAGKPLSASPEGAVLLLLATAASEGFAPAPLLALLKHPLVMRGDGRQVWLDGARSLDLALRGPRPAAGLAAIVTRLETGEKRTADIRAAALEWWRGAAPLLAGLEDGFGQKAPRLQALLDALRTTAETLCGDAIWAGEAGRALADLFADLESYGDEGPQDVAPEALPRLLRALFDAAVVRPARGGHARVFIWGLLEAKLQSANRVILGGLNEGVWPALPKPDPWLAPAIRRQFGLPSLERRIGLSAHDLAGALGAPEVLLTRAERDASAPTIASRFWLRLETMVGGLAAPLPTHRYDRLARALDGSVGQPAREPRPAPKPSAALRPKTISVTDVDRLAADPYAFYAKAILKLAALEPVDADPGPAWKGTLIHAVLDDWGKQDGWAAGALVPRMRRALEGEGVHPLTRSLWLPQMEEAAAWIEERVADQRAAGREPLVSEEWGETRIADITVKGRADRIDRIGDALAVIDYKTGAPPSDKQVTAGYALQLGLLGKIADDGGFKDIDGTTAAFEYWSFKRDGGSFGKASSPAGTGKTKIVPDVFVATIVEKFEAAARAWLTGEEPFTAKVAPDYTYTEYDHLMRLEEWRGRDG